MAELRRVFPSSAGHCFAVTRAPGRINLLGEHTDYNEGYVLPAATVQATYVAAVPRQDGWCRVWSAAFDDYDEFEVSKLSVEHNGSGWRRYIRGVTWALREAGRPVTGLDAVILGDLVIGAGVASSASVEVSFALAALCAAGQSMPAAELALACQRAENEFVGMRCGILDQFSSVLGLQGAALLLDCRSREWWPIQLGRSGVAFVVCDTGKPRVLVGSEYNRRRSQCEEAARALGVRALRDATEADLEAHRDDLDPGVYRRARHVISENGRVLAGVDALRHGDFAALGQLMLQTHASLRDDYEVSCAELDIMVEIATETAGCLGARLMGAGFGGSALAVVHHRAARDFCDVVEARYRQRTGLNGRTLITWPSQGAAIVAQGVVPS